MFAEPHPSFAFTATPKFDTGLWGVWDRRHLEWVVTAELDQEMAERMAARINEAYAAGFADATIVKSHSRARLRRLL